jgi:hypothetical protein
VIRSQPGQIVLRTPSQKHPIQWGEVPQTMYTLVSKCKNRKIKRRKKKKRKYPTQKTELAEWLK